jgi:uncharacterized membrane protein
MYVRECLVCENVRGCVCPSHVPAGMQVLASDITRDRRSLPALGIASCPLVPPILPPLHAYLLECHQDQQALLPGSLLPYKL